MEYEKLKIIAERIKKIRKEFLSIQHELAGKLPLDMEMDPVDKAFDYTLDKIALMIGQDILGKG